MRKGITKDTVIVIIIFLITAVVIIQLIMYFLPKGMIHLPKGNPTEVVRFIRYMGCAIASCKGGCDSSETIALPLEFGEGGIPSLGCNQLLHELGYCTGVNVGAKFCGDSTKYLNFTFKESTTYHSNYSISWDNPEVCSPQSQSGWQTDASCLGGWEGDVIDSECLDCMTFVQVVTIPFLESIVDVRSVHPEGRLLESSGCKKEDEYPYDRYSGSIWIPQSMITAGTCIENEEKGGKNLAWCDFTEGQEIKIWADTSVGSNHNLLEVPVLGGCFGLSLEGLPFHSCHQVIICDT